MSKKSKKPESLSPNGDASASEQTETVPASPLQDVGGDFSLTPPEHSGEEEQPTPARPRGRPRGTGSARTRTRKAVPEPVIEVPPDPALVGSCEMAIRALTRMAEKRLEFSDPGDEWRHAMADISARLLPKLLNSPWATQHPLEVTAAIHLASWVVPNAIMWGGRAVIGRKEKQKNAERNNGSIRSEADEKNPLDSSRTAHA